MKPFDPSPKPSAGSSQIPIPPPEPPAAAPTSEDAEAEARDRIMRLAAELDNVRKRTRRDIETARRQERVNVLRGFLEVLDNFDRALAAQGAQSNEWLEGLEGIHKQMVDTFARFGGQPIAAQGAAFDPHLHEAVATAHVEGTAPGIVVDVVKTGYAFSDGEVIRPAMVVVSN